MNPLLPDLAGNRLSLVGELADRLQDEVNVDCISLKRTVKAEAGAVAEVSRTEHAVEPEHLVAAVLRNLCFVNPLEHLEEICFLLLGHRVVEKLLERNIRIAFLEAD